jgi:[acyl-carrier-protein] S-malonyltransferase
MGKALYHAFPAARAVFQEVDDALSANLTRLIFEGPIEQLTLTENAQPALMATSLAMVRVLKNEGGMDLANVAAYVAGHSLGEYSALAAAGSLNLAEAAQLLRRRGEAMQAAVPVGEGAMVAILGLDLDVVAAVAKDAAGDGVCEVANDNAPGQVVLSGDSAAIERAAVLAKERGAKRAMSLPVSAPFHCAMLAPAAEVMADALGQVTLAAPRPAWVANVTATAENEPVRMRTLLVEQVTSTVRWRETVLYMKANGVDTLIELGAGKVLSTMVRRIDREVTGVSVQEPEDIDALIKSF